MSHSPASSATPAAPASSPSSEPFAVETFAQAFCRRHGVSEAGFEHAVLRRTLYHHAVPFYPFIHLFRPEFFAADLDLVRGAGQLRRVRDFSVEATEFAHHPANHGFLRRTLRVRVSTQRLRRLVIRCLRRPAVTEG